MTVATLPSVYSSLGILEHEKEIHGDHLFPPVEDITQHYTSDEAHVIEERRGVTKEPVAEAISEVSRSMVELLQRMGSSDVSLFSLHYDICEVFNSVINVHLNTETIYL